MLRIVVKYLVSLAVAIAIGGPIYAAVSSDNFRNCEQHQGQYPTTENKENKLSPVLVPTPNNFRIFWSCSGGYVSENGSAMTAIATVLLTAITGFLGYLAWDQGRTSRAQLRAYVSTIPRGMSLLEDGTIRMWLGQKNVGETPAFYTRVAWGIFVAPSPLEHPLKFEQDEKIKGASPVYYPGSDHTPSKPVKLSDEDLAKMLDKDSGAALYAAGVARYTDAFKREQTAEFCCFVDPGTFIEWYSIAQHKRKEVFPVPFRFAQFHNTASF